MGTPRVNEMGGVVLRLPGTVTPGGTATKASRFEGDRQSGSLMSDILCFYPGSGL